MPRMPITRLCERCGTEYHPNYPTKGRGEQRFCTAACATADRFGDPVEMACATCGGPIKQKSRKRVYCSIRCRDVARRGRPSPRRKGWDNYPAPVRDPESGCLRWQGPHHTNGYGKIGRDGYAHREAWIREVGPIPGGMTIDHVAKRGCVHRDCVEVAHLEPVTQAVNVQRGERAQRTHCPQKHEYTPDNTIIRRGKRECRTCVRARNLAAYYRRKAAKAAAA